MDIKGISITPNLLIAPSSPDVKYAFLDKLYPWNNYYPLIKNQ